MDSVNFICFTPVLIYSVCRDYPPVTHSHRRHSRHNEAPRDNPLPDMESIWQRSNGVCLLLFLQGCYIIQGPIFP